MVVTRIPVLATSQAAFLARCLIRVQVRGLSARVRRPGSDGSHPKGPTAEGEGGVRTARTETDGRHVIDEAAAPACGPRCGFVCSCDD